MVKTKTSNKQRIIILVEGGLMVALAFILSQFKLFEMPQGGSINLTGLPLVIYAYRRGWINGVFAGVVFGVLHFLLDPHHVFHPVSILGDYVVSYAVIGIVGFSFAKGLIGSCAKVILAYAVRFITGTVSGVVVFYMYAAEGQSVWAYSTIYNSYVFIEGALVAVVFGLLYKTVLKRIPTEFN